MCPGQQGVRGPSGRDTSRSLEDLGVNSVRLPLNEDCWLGIKGAPMPASTYRAAILNFTAELVSGGFVVLLDLHWTSHTSALADGQDRFLSADSLTFWTSVASQALLKSNPQVILEVFNEPGGFETWAHPQLSVGCFEEGASCAFAGYSQGIAAIRATGADNLVLVGGRDWCFDLQYALYHLPKDPLDNLALAWHPYEFKANCTNFGCQSAGTKAISLGYPVILTEWGPKTAPATVTPYVESVYRWASKMGASAHLFAWTWASGSGRLRLLAPGSDWLGSHPSAWGDSFRQWRPPSVGQAKGETVEPEAVEAGKAAADRAAPERDDRGTSGSFCAGVGWVDEFAEEFDGPNLNTSVWTIKEGAGNSYCRSATCTAEDVYLEGGALVLRTRRDATNQSAYTSGGVDTRHKVSWRHSPAFRICISAMLPGGAAVSTSGAGQGVWPAHWLMPDTGACDPDQGEMDIMEMINGDGSHHSTYHWQTTYPTANCSYPKGHEEATASLKLPRDWGNAFHEYAVERGPSHLAFAVDGKVILNRSSTSGAVPRPLLWDEPWFLILNSALGGGWPGEPTPKTQLPTYHRIDYVRAARRVY